MRLSIASHGAILVAYRNRDKPSTASAIGHYEGFESGPSCLRTIAAFTSHPMASVPIAFADHREFCHRIRTAMAIATIAVTPMVGLAFASCATLERQSNHRCMLF